MMLFSIVLLGVIVTFAAYGFYAVIAWCYGQWKRSNTLYHDLLLADPNECPTCHRTYTDPALTAVSPDEYTSPH